MTSLTGRLHQSMQRGAPLRSTSTRHRAPGCVVWLAAGTAISATVAVISRNRR